MFQAAEARGGVKTGWGQQIEGEDGWCAKADFQSAGKRCAAASRVAVGKSQGSGRREELLPRELAVRGSVPSSLLRGPITWMNAWGA